MRTWDPPAIETVNRITNLNCPTLQFRQCIAGSVIALSIFFVVGCKSEANKGLENLAKAYRQQRPFEARLTALPYAPYSKTRGSQATPIDQVAHDQAAITLLDTYVSNPNLRSAHGLGQYYVTEGNFKEAIRLLKSAETFDEKIPSIHNDLGVAELEQANAEFKEKTSADWILNLARAVDEFKSALESDINFEPALFNLAVCHQQMKLFRLAEQDWLRYLSIDPGSHWSQEATDNLASVRIEQKKVAEGKDQAFVHFIDSVAKRDADTVFDQLSQSRDRSGSYIIEKLVNSYLQKSIDGQPSEAEEDLQILEFAGQVEHDRIGDQYTLDLVRFYRGSSPAMTKLAAGGRDLMRQANAAYIGTDYRYAIDLFTNAHSIFVDVGDQAEAELAENWIGVAYLRQPNIEQALTVFVPLSESLAGKGYRWLLAVTLNCISDAQSSRREYSAVTESSRRALNLSNEIGDTGTVIRNLSTLGGTYYMLGDYTKSLDFGLRGLSIADEHLFPPGQFYPLLAQISMSLNGLGLYKAALDYQHEALQIAAELHSPTQTIRSYEFLAMIFGNLKQFNKAIENGRHALELAETETKEPNRSYARGSALHRLGHLYRLSGDFESSIASLDKSVELFEHSNFPAYIYEAHKGKLLTYIAQKKDALAEEELKTALDLFESNREKIVEETSRETFFDAGNDIYDIAIDFAFSRQSNSKLALDYAESSHARSLLDLIRSRANVVNRDDWPELAIDGSTRPLSVDEIKDKLSDKVQLVQYAVLEDKLLIWVIKRNEITPIEIKIPYAELSKQVNQFLDLVHHPSDDQQSVKESAKTLCKSLFDPIKSYIEKDKQVYIVPDKILNYVPFEALVSQDSEKYVMEDYTIGITPSASVFILLSNVASEKSKRPVETALSVGNPKFDTSLFAPLTYLAASATEAESVASFYKTKALIGDRAKKELVIKQMEQADVIHLATHGIVDDKSPMLSKLLLTKPADGQPSGDGVLYTYDLYKLSMPNARLVVLSACQTGIEHYYKGEGMVGLARPLMAARVPLVVASLWAVDSDATAKMMINFHRFRGGEHHSTIESLRQAQLGILQSDNQAWQHPYYWASFMTLGGYAQY